MTPKPPSPRSVSATLAAADFRAIGDKREARTEGFQTEWAPGAGVRVRFVTDDPDMRSLALRKMAGTLRRKGWQVNERHDRAYLTVTGG